MPRERLVQFEEKLCFILFLNIKNLLWKVICTFEFTVDEFVMNEFIGVGFVVESLEKFEA